MKLPTNPPKIPSNDPAGPGAGLVDRRLADLVMRYRTTSFARPVAEHNLDAYRRIRALIAGHHGTLILDAGCGTGDSTRALAAAYPRALVVGIDRSEARLHRRRPEPVPDNAVLVRADLMDIYRLAARDKLRLSRHTIFYPNPYPKPAHLQRRWHGSPVFPDMLALGGTIELRTNRRTYAEEFALALRLSGVTASAEPFVATAPFVSLFEAKYAGRGHDLWQVVASLPGQS